MKQETTRIQRRLPGVTWRSLLLGCLLVPINCYWVVLTIIKYHGLDGGCLPLFIQPVFILFVVTFVNFFLSKRWPQSSLTQGELLVIYIMLVTSMTLAGKDTLPNMFGAIVHPFRFATPENEWENLFFRYIPKWLTVTDKVALDGLYEGNSSIYMMKNFRPWIQPLTIWGLLFLVLIFLLMCVTTIIRKRWTHEEKLAFPIIQLPLRMTHQQDGKLVFFTNKVMWIGFGIAATITLINGLHHIYPTVPYLKWVKLNRIGRYFTEKPWNVLRSERISMYPFAIGLAFFLPLDLLFSCWFFYVFRLFESVLGAALGLGSLPGFPYFNEQASGSWIGLSLIAIWISRRQIRDVFKKAIGRGADIDDSDEPLPYRWAVIGAVLSMIFVTGLCLLAGMSIPLIIAFFSISLLLAIAMTRVRAEFGAPHEIFFVNPQDIITSVVGTRRLNPSNLTMMSMFYWFNRCYRNHPMPNQLEAFKMSEYAKINNRKLMSTILLASALSILAVYWANLHITYKYGGSAAAVGFRDGCSILSSPIGLTLASWV